MASLLTAAFNDVSHGLGFANHQEMMERSLIVQEYFKLMVLLNRANANPNENTQIQLKIERKSPEEIVLLASANQKFRAGFLILCRWVPLERWQSTGHSGLLHFEEHCAAALNQLIENEKLMMKSASTEKLNLLSLNIQNQLKTLALTQKFSEF